MELSLSRGVDSAPITVQVKRRAIDKYDNPIDRAHNNPLMDSRQYGVEFTGWTLGNIVHKHYNREPYSSG